MARLPLLGGAYSARSIIANCQKCINLYPEANPKDSPVPITHYQRPGFRPLASGPLAPVRGLWRNNQAGGGFVVIGQGVYSIGPTWALTLLGTLLMEASTPVSFTDNGIVVFLVDGSQYGYQITLAGLTFSVVDDPTGTFLGADKVDYIDTFILFNQLPQSQQFGSTLSNSLTFDPLYTAGKTDYPDLLVTLIVNRHEILLLGQVKSEQWYDAGNATFPFAELPGAYIEHGTVAKYSVASSDISVFFLGQDLQGAGVVFRVRGYDTTRISNHALEFQIAQMKAKTGTISDAIGFTFQLFGHYFYVLTFPAGDQTWVFDDSLGGDPHAAWHQWAWPDSEGTLHRARANCFGYLNDTLVVGDWQNGTLYALDPNVFTDTVGGVASLLPCIRTFPHIGEGEMNLGMPGLNRPVPIDGRRVQFAWFEADMELGLSPFDAFGNSPVLQLRWSDDRGRTFGNGLLIPAGAPGQYNTWPIARTLGIARDRIFELEWAWAGQASLNGAWIEGKVLLS